MSFQIVFGQNQSEDNKLDKKIANTVTYSGVLKDSSDIINPVIVMEGNVSLFASLNYFTIPLFGRSYFISNIKSVTAQLVEIRGRCDVLSSFKDAIRSNSAIIMRQEKTWNLYLNDGSFSVYQNEETVTKRVGAGALPFGKYNYVLTVAGG